MFIVWGSRGFLRELGVTNFSCDCPNCHNEVTYEGINQGRKFTFFWTPLFKTRSKYYISCPICNYAKQVTKKEMREEYLV